MKQFSIYRRRPGLSGRGRPLLVILIALLLAACGAPSQATRPTTPTTTARSAVGIPPTQEPSGSAVGETTEATAAPATTAPPTGTAIPTTTVPPTGTAIPTTTASVEPTTPVEPTVVMTPARPDPAIGSEILFLREAALMAYDTDTRQERRIATDVTAFAAAADGRTLALARTSGQTTDIWLVNRNGDELRQVTANSRVESSLSWAPDGQALVYASANVAPQRPLDLQDWGAWCGSSEVRLLNVQTGSETLLADGCDPAFSNDGQRIAFATPPTGARDIDPFPTVANSIRLINRQGENGWNFAQADGGMVDTDSGLVVYAPFWSPDSAYLGYHRFVGYRALVDLDYTEMAGSFEGNGSLLMAGAGWLRPGIFSPDGTTMAVVEHNYSDARGFGGYEAWRVHVLRLGEPDTVALPSGTQNTAATVIDRLPRATGAAWSPDGTALAVILPTDWSAGVSPDTPVFETTGPGDLWLWTLTGQPDQFLAGPVDYASPLIWLPPL